MSKKLGFTLIELLVVIVIIGIMAALISTNLVGGRTRASDSQKKSNLNQLKSSLYLYFTDYNKYPTCPVVGDNNGLNFCGCGTSGTDKCGTKWNVDSKVYLSKLAKTGNFYDFRYYSCGGGDNFRLKITLTNASDQDIAESKSRCPAATCIGQNLNYDTAVGNTDYVLCAD